ncbi:MAG: glycosyltransferase [Candidatus Binatia bacterium]
MTGLPKISICIPTYNGAAYLGQAIDSVLAQEFADFECVVCDNASTDATPAIVDRYRDHRFRPLRYGTHVSQAANWNRCLTVARGEYIVLLHSDDVLLPRFLGSAARVMDEKPEVGLVHCAVQRIDQDGRSLQCQRSYPQDGIREGVELFRRLLDEGCVINPAGVMCRKSVLEKVGGFSEEIVWGVDWHMWLRIAMNSAAAYLAEVLALYREHSQSETTGVFATARNGVDEAWVVHDVFRRLPAASSDLRSLKKPALRSVAHRTWCYAEEMCRRGSMDASRRGIRTAVAISPRLLLNTRVWGLWMATYFGYAWFERLRGWKRRSGGISVP